MVLRANGVQWCIHYIDNFLTAGRPGSPECSTHLEIIKRICAVLGFPLKWEKMAGPCTLIEFLGILLDTIKMELRLPEEKVQQLVELLDEWSRKKACRKRVTVPHWEASPCM